MVGRGATLTGGTEEVEDNVRGSTGPGWSRFSGEPGVRCSVG